MPITLEKLKMYFFFFEMAACYLLRVNSYLPVPCDLYREGMFGVGFKEGGVGHGEA